MPNPTVPITYMISGKKPHRSNKYIEERKENEEKLQVTTNRVIAPIWLSLEAKKLFKKSVNELKIVKLITVLDVNTLAVYCDNVAKYMEIDKQVTTIKKSDLNEIEQIKIINQLTQSQLKLADTIRKYAVEFGLTPQSRAKLAIPRGKEKKKTEAEEMFDV